MESFSLAFLIVIHSFRASALRPEGSGVSELASRASPGWRRHDGDGAFAVSQKGIIQVDQAASGNISGVGPHAVHSPHAVSEQYPSSNASEKKDAGLLEIHAEKHHFRPTPPAASLKFYDVFIFYGILYTLGFGIFFIFRYVNLVKVNCSKALRQVAMLYWRWSRLAPLGASCILFALADVLAQGAGAAEDHGHVTWKSALIASSAIFNAVLHHRFYIWLDGKVEEGEDFRSKAKQVAKMIGLHLVVFLPLAVPFFLILADFFRRTFDDAESNCSTASIADVPRNLAESTSVAAGLFASSYGWSTVFWPGSHIVNFTIVQSWAPGFRSSWDGIAVVMWNVYVLVVRNLRNSVDPVAVGPMLVDRDELTKDVQKQAPTNDCNSTSAAGLGLGFFHIAYLILKYTWIALYKLGLYTYYFLRWCSLTFKKETWLLSCFIKRKIWESWCIICFLVRKLYMLLWILLSYICTIIWRLLMIPFKIFDNCKWYIGLFFVPQFFDYNGCPCPKADFDKSWTEPGVIYTGTLLGAK